MNDLNPIEFTDLAVKKSNNLPAKDEKSGLIFIGVVLALFVISCLIYHISRLSRENKKFKGNSNLKDPKNNKNEDE